MLTFLEGAVHEAKPTPSGQQMSSSSHEALRSASEENLSMRLLHAQPAALKSTASSGVSALKQARSLMAAEVDRLSNVSAVMGA